MAINLKNFILHSDYMSYAFLDEVELSVTFPSRSLSANQRAVYTSSWVTIPHNDFEIKYLEKASAADSVTSRPPNVWATPSGQQTSGSSPGKVFYVERQKNRIRAHVESWNGMASSQTTPALTVSFKVRIMATPIRITQ